MVYWEVMRHDALILRELLTENPDLPLAVFIDGGAGMKGMDEEYYQDYSMHATVKEMAIWNGKWIEKDEWEGFMDLSEIDFTKVIAVFVGHGGKDE